MRRGPNVTGRSFRLNGPRKLIDIVKTHDGDLVEVVGLVRKNDLRDNGLGARVGNTRVVIGAPRSGDPMQSSRAPVPEGIAVMDATSIRVLDDRCPIVALSAAGHAGDHADPVARRARDRGALRPRLGPGGQNVNKVSTAVQLRFDVRRRRCRAR
jgi:hypothetical protein